MLKKISIVLLITAAMLTCGAVFAQSTPVDPYSAYNKHKNAIKDTKIQVGDRGETIDVCDPCASDAWDRYRDYRDHVWAQRNTSNLYFSTEGNQDEDWRAELRFLDDFRASDNEDAYARMRIVNGHTSDGFTVFQLHNSAASGPPLRLEVQDGDTLVAVVRRDGESGTGVENYDMVNDVKNLWMDVTVSLDSGLRLNINVNGRVETIDLDGRNDGVNFNWEDSRNFYWKAGMYLQREGQAKVRFNRITW